MPWNKPWAVWINEYAGSHQHPANRFCQTLGIPMIVVSLLLFIAAPFVSGLWLIAAVLFILGWVFQFVGHAFEKKPPEFLKDWRFLFVRPRWWLARMKGMA